MVKQNYKSKTVWNKGLLYITCITLLILILSLINHCKKYLYLSNNMSFLFINLYFFSVLLYLIKNDNVKKSIKKDLNKKAYKKVLKYYNGWCNAHLQRINCLSVLIAVLASIIPKSGNHRQPAVICLSVLGGWAIGAIWRFSRESYTVISFDKKVSNHILGIINIILWSIILIFIVFLSFNTVTSFYVVTITILVATITNYALISYCRMTKQGITKYINKKIS
ncbi:hypothetical protein OZX58_03405 [Lactobacillus sp. ESL0680]|uniref:hypothetical protein n=1 Tax=Lactobacillus sp. ESL0680 TaxID=2983210 RepID=UPI0023FA2776|nr:hypothetical protein [Lactobacillus sp. ESL0680]WEV39297.1 hypothetical protein OZX58_03405 [Lactobacillus sp. ESL0680]